MLIVSVVTACGESSVTFVDPPTPPPAALVIRVLPDSEDVAAAAALGWAAAIPGAEVVLSPSDSSAPTLRLTTNASGLADFGLVAPGRYAIAVSRWLSSSEAQRLPLGEDVVGWVWRDVVTVAGGGTETIFAPASRRKSLLISEWAFNQKGDYYHGGFLELYNNADTTIYLDGIVVGSAFALTFDYPNFPCAVYGSFTNDRTGLWTRRMAQVPGAGQNYPLAPHRTAVIATDAVDHSQYIQGGLDLRQADFELQGTADVDNPAVPNMPSIGHNPGFFGHGIEFGSLDDVAFAARPVTLQELARMRDPLTNDEYAKVPREKLLDVLVIGPEITSSNSLCPQVVHRIIDRSWTFVRESDSVREYLFSVSRRLVPEGLASGRLQHSRRSASDFARTARTPGRVP